MKNLRLRLFSPILFISLLAMIVFGSGLAAGQAPDQTELLWINPALATSYVGQSTDVTLQLDDFVNVYGGQVDLTFDPAVLSVVDADGGTPGVQITPGSCPQPDFVVMNSADNGLGTVSYAATQLAPTPPCDGGTMASVEFMCNAVHPGTPVTIVSSLISDPDGNPIPHSVQHGTVECLESGFDIIGGVALQLWPDPSGTVVDLVNEGTGLVDDSALVGPGGTFAFVGQEGVLYTVEASMDRYLSVAETGVTGLVGETIDLGTSTLPAGDLNGDGVINILDIVAVAGNFMKNSPQPWDVQP